MLRAALTGLLLAAAACGGPKKPPPDQPAGPADAGVEITTDGASAAASDPALSEAECDRFVDHVVDLAAAMLAARAENPDHANTPEEIAAIQDKLRSEMRGECLRVDRATFDCAMKATTATALAACQASGGDAPPR